MLPDASENQNEHSQTDGVHMSSFSHSVVNQQPQHQVHRAFSAMTVPISLSPVRVLKKKSSNAKQACSSEKVPNPNKNKEIKAEGIKKNDIIWSTENLRVPQMQTHIPRKK